MTINKNLLKLYSIHKVKIIQRLAEFRQIWINGSEKDVFIELIFCLLTPQSKAKYCWLSVQNLCDKNLLFKNDTKLITNELNKVRFKNKKSEYIEIVKKQFIINNKISIRSKIAQLENDYTRRDWLIANIKGYGYKEASHFLRNIGLGTQLAILDRHILKNLYNFGIIKAVPDSLTKKNYLEIEKKMQNFAQNIKIPINHLDLLLWCKETGEVFK